MDKGLEFVGVAFQQALNKMGIHQKFVTSWNPLDNGVIERLNKTLVNILRCLTFQQPKSWDMSLQIASLAYNSAWNSAIRESPFFIMFLRDSILPFSAMLDDVVAKCDINSYPQEMLQRAQAVFRLSKAFAEEAMSKRIEKANRGRKFKNISFGNMVYIKKMVRNSKLDSR